MGYYRETINKKWGYTLIEVLVAVAIFSTVISVPTGFFISSLKSQHRALALRETIDNTSYLVEYVSRALRMAKKAVDDDCIDAKTNYKITRAGKGIKFENYEDPPVCQEFYLDTDKRLYESKDGAPGLPLTPDDLEITQFQFHLSGQTQEDNLQPQITMLLEIGKKGASGLPKIRIQTTVSQRNLDIEK
ncbi:MAG: PilW family protein [Candidatus Nealsonbacteria bacterium]